ncbi:plasminogen-like [Lineus longissimus]|uniref:plasminogen-like n=1 Tax=Lineus longissimus TaxID=88925 RepID=UPI00315D432A
MNTSCSTKYFGDNCEYQCHCNGDEDCSQDGSCPNGCASGWDGEYCQRGNVAAGKSSDASQGTTNGTHYASLALDGYTNQAFSRCSHTNQREHWWQVDLGRNYVLFTVTIWTMAESECKNTTIGAEYRGTQSTTLMGFTCADWLVYNGYYTPADSYNYCRNPDDAARGPWCYITATHTYHYDYCFIPYCKNKLTNFKILIDENLCHHETGTVQFSRAQEIKCDTTGPVVGRRLKIQRMEPSSSLTLCEVSVQASNLEVRVSKVT